MNTPTWPLFGLSIRTPRLELRPVDDELAERLCHLGDDGIHPPDDMPFQVPWTRTPLPRRHWDSRQFYWRCWADWSIDRWRLIFAAMVGDTLVGTQEVNATAFPADRGVGSGSWIGRAYQGAGLGTEMRQAMLHLAFEGLGAERAESGAWADNVASRRVSEKCGYKLGGNSFCRSDEDRPSVSFILERADWLVRRRDDITVDGLEQSLPLFGLG